ncbi:MAG: M15 family metallopeptidase [Brevundimonas sp.]|uniref:M15 family metallopeptidase n=1 Tax=Brevundimonas sp. TaxID=1871086 RepID=UPI001A2E5D66|nr:M15 family metallopeptidase [Brevundimonas sp.]MBJ7446866.1 M15 family metallopeptidase [Brevundimonas sp.]
MPYALGAQSRARLKGVHPQLVRVVERAIEISPQDFLVLEGVRTPQRQRQLYGQGRTRQELARAGVDVSLAKPSEGKVTWTLISNHFVKADGYGHAVDLAPYPVDWEGPTRFPKFDAIAKAMFQAARELGIGLRWGADWDRDGKPRERGETDSPHFELAA